MRKPTELAPVKESTEDYERIEKRILRAFREWLYEPLLKELQTPRRVLQNTKSDLAYAIRSGRVSFSKGVFTGKFDAAISKELRALGAKWDKKLAAYKLPASELPSEIAHAISLSQSTFLRKLEKLEQLLMKKLPAGIAGSLKLTALFDSTLFKVDRQLRETLKSISVPPALTTDEAQRIAAEWQENMDKWIQDFAAEEITKLRKDIQKSAFSGQRYESVVESIRRSYGVTQAKAKFLARQETSLLMTKFKETRYTSAGIHEYKWRCVAGSKLHPVRPSHKILDGKIFRWDDPPTTTAPSEPARRNNPGEDFNCRCAAIPIIRRQE